MLRVLIHSTLCLSLGIGAASCARDRGDQSQSAADASQKADRDQVEVTGCLTANVETNQFVLTANTTALTSLTNRAAAGEAESYHYQLVGGTNLQQYVGKEVMVKGSIEGKGKDVNIETKEPETTAPKSRGEEVTPAIESKHEIEMQVERLNVASVTPTGSVCQVGQP
jgi:hypothetical protein